MSDMNPNELNDNKPKGGWHLVRHHGRRWVINPVRLRYERLYQQRLSVLVFDLALIVFGLVLFAALIFFWNHPVTSNRNVDLAFELPETAISGALEEIKINYSNENRDVLEDAYLVLKLPQNFHLVDYDLRGLEYDSAKNIIYLNDLPRDAHGTIILRGYSWQALDSAQNWGVTLNYNNLDIPHSKSVSADLFYTHTLLVADLEIPDNIYTNSNATARLKLTNNSPYDIEKGVVQVYTTSDLFITGEAQDYRWSDIRIPAGGSWHQEWRIYSQQSVNPEINWQISIGDEILVNISRTLFVKQPAITLDWQLLTDGTARAGQPVAIRYYIHNREQTSLDDYRLSLVDTTAQWRVDVQSEKHSSVSSDQEKYIEAVIRIFPVVDNITKAPELQAVIIWTGPLGAGKIYSLPKQLSIRPEVTISSKIVYYLPSGDQIAYGPLPPIVGEATSYWINLQVKPDFGGFRNMRATIDLPAHVELLDFSSNRGRISGKENIVWEIDSYDKGVNPTIPAINLKVEIIPTAAQAGQNLTLINSVRVLAESGLEGTDIEVNTGIINNDMSRDFHTPNDGRVESRDIN
ncbi:MAG: hypothetical protein NUV82_00615 [Candidatus Komeilibacteria bacterium]|nr:hypothetical protein [Candidatus Komeilibacteria bacterium]